MLTHQLFIWSLRWLPIRLISGTPCSSSRWSVAPGCSSGLQPIRLSSRWPSAPLDSHSGILSVDAGESSRVRSSPLVSSGRQDRHRWASGCSCWIPRAGSPACRPADPSPGLCGGGIPTSLPVHRHRRGPGSRCSSVLGLASCVLVRGPSPNAQTRTPMSVKSSLSSFCPACHRTSILPVQVSQVPPLFGRRTHFPHEQDGVFLYTGHADTRPCWSVEE